MEKNISEKGRMVLVKGTHREVRDRMAELSVELSRTCEKMLFIDTMNSMDPHHPVYRVPDQESLFKRIYCARTPKPYDLLARLRTAKYFIKRNRIGAVLINSLTLLFEDSDEDEVNPVLRQILAELKELTEENGLITIIGSSPRDAVPVRQAEATIKAAGMV